MKINKKIILKAPDIDFKRIHPMILVLGKRKLTQGKVSLYFHDVISWLKSAQLSLSSYRSHTDKLKDQSFVDELNKEEKNVYEFLELSTFYLENAVIRLSAIRDKIAITALVYYLHPDNLGTYIFEIKGCRCGNEDYTSIINEENCNFGALMRFLKQQNATGALFEKLQQIENDKEIQWLIHQRNNILHRISQYRWKGLGIFPQGLSISYENGREKCAFSLGSPEHTLEKEVPKIETVYNKFVEFSEELEQSLFPRE